MIDPQLAKQLAHKYHEGQFRNDGVTPYIIHPEAVASKFSDPKFIATAWLHDVIEDCGVTGQDLLDAGIPAEVVEAVKLLTRTKQMNYLEAILRIKGNEIARQVKIADIQHNILTVSSADKRDKYQMALWILI